MKVCTEVADYAERRPKSQNLTFLLHNRNVHFLECPLAPIFAENFHECPAHTHSRSVEAIFSLIVFKRIQA